jgi:hypothetical protein
MQSESGIGEPGRCSACCFGELPGEFLIMMNEHLMLQRIPGPASLKKDQPRFLKEHRFELLISQVVK